MRKIFFYGPILIIGYVIFILLKGYFTAPVETRDPFLIYALKDIQSQYRYAKKAGTHIPEKIIGFIQNQKAVYAQLINQIVKSIDAYYAQNGTYPEVLGSLVKYENFPKDTYLEYVRTETGYELRLKNRKGEVVGEVIKNGQVF